MTSDIRNVLRASAEDGGRVFSHSIDDIVLRGRGRVRKRRVAGTTGAALPVIAWASGGVVLSNAIETSTNSPVAAPDRRQGPATATAGTPGLKSMTQPRQELAVLDQCSAKAESQQTFDSPSNSRLTSASRWPRRSSTPSTAGTSHWPNPTLWGQPISWSPLTALQFLTCTEDTLDPSNDDAYLAPTAPGDAPDGWRTAPSGGRAQHCIDKAQQGTMEPSAGPADGRAQAWTGTSYTWSVG